MKKDDIIFYERQYVKRGLLLLIFIPVIILCIIPFGMDKSSVSDFLLDAGFVITTSLVLLMAAYTFFVNMKTVVDCNGIHIRMWLFPFYTYSKSFFWDDISEAYIRKYNPILEYGGWGLRGGAYNMSGNVGLQLILTYKGKTLKEQVLIGTNKPDELSEVLQKLGKSDEKKHG